ncbi:Para-hydroxybenzoate--polyprenyltransferase, mitochondrial precursor (PHB:polyprenyltransferase) [Tulasnella sp. UAMH 9824]|nr:Para-hydroxybenzoate--polyprenyltransferase, mitochondrial precursor (PHB:polyprenyltransferase) [Tulasnella sp. UAMH 9824]
MSTTTSPVKTPTFIQKAIDIAFPYIKLCRINGLLGVWLTFWPCVWGVLLAAYVYRVPPSTLMNILPFLFVGCASLHSAACTINDIFDRDMDLLVARTKNRPIPSGAVSVRNAWIFMAIQVIGFFYLLTWANRTCALVTLANLPLQFAYPLFKRFTYWPSAFLGLTFGWGSLVGWSAITGSLSWKVNAPLYAAGVCWAFGYDIIYAFQDKHDDPQAGVKSTALILENRRPKVFLSILAVGFITFFYITGQIVAANAAYFNLTLIATAMHVAWQISTVDLENPDECFQKFYSNSWIGFVMLPGLLLNYTTRVA